MLRQYWFRDLPTKRSEGLWRGRELRGLHAPTFERLPDGRIAAIEMPESTKLPQ